MLVDNFQLITDKLLRFNNKGVFPTLFYAVEIIKRKKDPGNEDGKNEELIDLFMIYSKEDLMKYEEKIKKICNENNARAYIGINATREVDFLKALVEHYNDALINSYEHPGSVNFRSGEYIWRRCVNKVDDGKYFMVDCDTQDMNDMATIKKIITDCRGASEIKGKNGQGENKIIVAIPTLNGMHFITRHFDTGTYENELKNTGIDATCKKHSLTLLYANIG
jgi:hypothetical protein